jgi:anti-sigma regulatory factor (Ser/Thr protein kinase)
VIVMRTTMTLPTRPAAVHDARAFVHDTFGDWHVPVDLEDAELVVSELVTNAMRYEAGELTVALTSNAAGVWIDVTDGDTRESVPRLVAVQHAAESGRSLTIVDSLAESWGVTPTDTGRHVWVHLPAAGHPFETALAREIVTGYVHRVVHGHAESGTLSVAEQIAGLGGDTLRRVINEMAHLAAELVCLCAYNEDADTIDFWSAQVGRMHQADITSRRPHREIALPVHAHSLPHEVPAHQRETTSM